MNTQNETDSDAMLRGQAQILQYIYGALDGMAIRCCVELHIADIINNHGRPTTLSEISTAIDSPSINVDGLRRLMTFLVNRKVFDEMVESEESECEPLYSLNYCSKWLLRDTNVTLAPLVMMRTDPVTNLPLHALSRSIKEGGTAFKAAHGKGLFDFCSLNSEFNRVFNEAMACTATITTNAVISHYKDGFLGSKGSVVDVGGGTGIAISEIVKAYPHLKGINFDLSHVVSTAPKYDGITHVAGDMFKSIPPAETIFMKWILHDWSDDDCIKILQNCQKAIPKETGKLVIVEIVQQPIAHGIFDDIRLTYDLVMFSHFSGGRERTEREWKKLLNEGGFTRYNIIKIPTLQSVIEVFP
ncbi:putative O-methyltransferase COMT-type, S-adenosyl-L-methionine-dependent methyltransferase [Helianthus annuus]|uniref:O-methyltransferase COMT-type, S-adenosyl-L-methionine-dependent methyltransferase n=1 Tax=Helianthus annuus TaxID=4232 RepID=A0A251RQ95_HELAN|nr:desmethylxanthohumol 6'-O-methyltransferase [Helianthus annuus]KAF5755990.1 putative O-methyltransferase COMT-type, S-adenosyl-L-methionine-dependent methyltransferase [Helianthus annuus]